MKVVVAPARKPSSRRVISERPLDVDTTARNGDGSVHLTFFAKGIYNDKSTYEYTLVLSRDELAALVRAADGA